MIPYPVSNCLIDADSIIYKICGKSESYKWIYELEAGGVIELEKNSIALLRAHIVALGSPVGEYKKDIRIKEGYQSEAYMNLHNVISYYMDCLGAGVSKTWYFTSTDKTNFRYGVAKTLPYKGGRPPRPQTYEWVRDNLFNLLTKFDMPYVVITGAEADDALADINTADMDLLCHIDKDIDQVAGYHWNPDQNRYYTVSPEEATKFLWRQVVMGDRGTDNIPGMKYWMGRGRMGENSYQKHFSGCRTEADFKAQLHNIYKQLLVGEQFDEELYQARLKEQHRLVYLGDYEYGTQD